MCRLLRTLVAFLALSPASSAETSDEKIGSSPTSVGVTTTEDLPASVDLRPRMQEWGLVPRRQGRRNTCSVFAATGVLEYAASKHYDKGTRLSVEYLNWACNEVINNHTHDRGQFFRDLLHGYEEYGICAETDLPYGRRFDPALTPSAEIIQSAEKIRDLGLQVHWLRRWRKTPGLGEWNVRDIKRVLAKGYPVAAGASHSRIIVGHQDGQGQPGGGVFHCQDSGAGQWTVVTYQFALDNMNDLFWVEAP